MSRFIRKRVFCFLQEITCAVYTKKVTRVGGREEIVQTKGGNKHKNP